MTISGPGAAAAKDTERNSPEPVLVLVSVNVGTPKDVPWQGKTVHTGVWKRPVHGPAMVRRLNIDGDGQGDLAGHGGEQRAVLVYQLDSYRHWERHFGREDFGYGQFGENLTVDGMADAEVCIGDRYRIGEAEFEVTQPRVTCYRVGLRLGEPELPALLVSHHRPGFYMRVITEGHIQSGDQITTQVRARNDDLTNSPELINTDPYGQGWMFEVETDPATQAKQLDALMDADGYRALAGT